jgi:hypothetical protein
LLVADAPGGVAADSLPWIEPVYECVPLAPEAEAAAAPLVGSAPVAGADVASAAVGALAP